MKLDGSKKTTKQAVILILMLAVSPLILTGCLAAAAVGGGAVAGAGTIAYIKGELKSTEGYSIDETWAATVAAIDELQFIVINKVKDAVSAELKAQTADNKTVNIELKRIANNLTEIKIRVDTFGDEALSRYILNKIQANLK